MAGGCEEEQSRYFSAALLWTLSSTTGSCEQDEKFFCPASSREIAFSWEQGAEGGSLCSYLYLSGAEFLSHQDRIEDRGIDSNSTDFHSFYQVSTILYKWYYLTFLNWFNKFIAFSKDKINPVEMRLL